MVVDGKKIRNRFRTYKDPVMNVVDERPKPKLIPMNSKKI
jgi:hypothetical protein